MKIQKKNSLENDLAKLDRYIISKTDELESGVIFTVNVNDGYLIILKEYDEEKKEKRVKTYFSEFDSELDISFKDLF